MDPIEELKRLASEVPGLDAILEQGANEGERWCRVSIVSDRLAASICVWCRAMIGGMADVEIIDGDGNNVLFRHFEPLGPGTLLTAWQILLPYVSPTAGN